jgi:transcription elongation factor GreB
VSKAFTREEDDGGPMIVPARAPLPAGVPNYVTARGMIRLREELKRLEDERERIDAGTGHNGGEDGDRLRRRTLVNARIGALAARIGGAVLVEAPSKSPGEVRFGATVTVRAEGLHPVRRFTIVGVDEADAATGRVAFVSPIARALLGRTLGDTVTVRTGHGDEELVIEAIAYDSSEPGLRPRKRRRT